VVGRRLVPPHPLRFLAGVERKARFSFSRISLCPLAMLTRKLVEPSHGLRHDSNQGLVGVRLAGAQALGEPFLEDQLTVLVAALFDPIQVEGVPVPVVAAPGDQGRAMLAFEGIAERQDGVDDGVILDLQGLDTQQAERLEALVPGPGLAVEQVRTELSPAVEQPVGAFERGFELENEGGGMIGIGGQGRTTKLATLELPGELVVDVGDEGFSGVIEEPAADGGDLGLAAQRLGWGHVADIGGEARGLGAIGAFGLPAGGQRAPDEAELDVVTRLEAGNPGSQALLKHPGILAGQDDGLGGEAVLAGVELDAFFGLLRLRPATPGAVPAADLGALGLGLSLRFRLGCGHCLLSVVSDHLSLVIYQLLKARTGRIGRYAVHERCNRHERNGPEPLSATSP
jgi:hypothetical protein